MTLLSSRPVGDDAGDGGGGGHGGAHQVGAAAAALAALEVAVGGRGAALAGLSLSGFMPRHMEQPGSRHSKPAARKISSRPSSSAWAFTRPEPGTTMARTSAATVRPSAIFGGGAQVLDAAVGAGADEHHVDLGLGDRLAGLRPM